MDQTARLSRRDTLPPDFASAAIGFSTIIPVRFLGSDAPIKKINILLIGHGRIGGGPDMRAFSISWARPTASTTW
jgi:hypothetical protein